MQQTDNLDLELYEPTDNANLLDGYNASMRKLDQRDGEVSTLITGLNAAVTLAQADATQALADAATADGKAVVADGKAVVADGKATQALAALAGYELDHIETSDLNTKFTMATDTIADTTGLSFHAILLKIPGTTSALMIGRLAFKTNRQITADDRDQQLPAITLTDWSEIEEPTSFLPAYSSWVTAGAHNGIYCVRKNLGFIYNGATQTIPVGTYYQGVVVAYVTAV